MIIELNLSVPTCFWTAMSSSDSVYSHLSIEISNTKTSRRQIVLIYSFDLQIIVVVDFFDLCLNTILFKILF